MKKRQIKRNTDWFPFGKNVTKKNLTQDEIESFHLSTSKLSYEEAVREYENRADTRLGKLVADRELPVLHRAKEIIDKI